MCLGRIEHHVVRYELQVCSFRISPFLLPIVTYSKNNIWRANDVILSAGAQLSPCPYSAVAPPE